MSYVKGFLVSRPLAPRWFDWFRKSLSSCYARTTSSVHRGLSKKPGSLEWRCCLFRLDIQIKGSKIPAKSRITRERAYPAMHIDLKFTFRYKKFIKSISWHSALKILARSGTLVHCSGRAAREERVRIPPPFSAKISSPRTVISLSRSSLLFTPYWSSLARAVRLTFNQGSIEGLLRVYWGSIEGLVRVYWGSIEGLLRVYGGGLLKV